MYVIRIVGLAAGGYTGYEGQYVQRLHFVGGDREAVLDATHFQFRALQFPSVVEAMEFWRQVEPRQPIRPDGKPNRPLTTFTVEVKPLEVSP